MEVAGAPELEQADASAGLDDEDGDAAVVDSHAEPGGRVALERAAGAVPDDVAMAHLDSTVVHITYTTVQYNTDQDVHTGFLLGRLRPVEMLSKARLYTGSLL